MIKTTLLFNKINAFLSLTVFTASIAQAQCPQNISVSNDPGQCGATVSYLTTGGQSANGVVNSSATNGLTGWTLANGGDGWIVSDGYFLSSYEVGTMSQVIDLTTMNLEDSYMDSQPAITVSEDYIGWNFDYADTYSLTVELRGENNNVIARYVTGNITTTNVLQTASHVFTGYGTGVRKVYIAHTGVDTEYWAGHYGAAVTNVQCTVALPALEAVQTAGLPSGSVFPIGSTTNTYLITQGDAVITCSFNVMVNDTEAPAIVTQQGIVAEINADGTAVITPEDIDGGSTDNCDDSPVFLTLDTTTFTCSDIGDNTVTLIVTDEAGNIATATVTVTVQDTNNYCPAAGLKNNFLSNVRLYPNPTSGLLTIEAGNYTIDKTEIYDIHARLLKTVVTTQASFNADVSSFNTGVYFVKLYSGKDIVTHKIVKQ